MFFNVRRVLFAYLVFAATLVGCSPLRTSSTVGGQNQSDCRKTGTCPTLERTYDIPESVGTVFWSGQFSGSAPGRKLPDGMAQLAAKGFQNIRILLSPAALKSDTYDITSMNFTENNFLEKAIQSPEFSQAIADPRLKTIAFATFDALVVGTNGSLRRMMDNAFLQSRQTDIVNDYKNFALSLFRTYKNTGKTFIISNWETDNAIYCGSAYAFDKDFANTPVNGTSFRTWCLNNYSAAYAAKDPQAAITAIKLWFSYRQQGIQLARQQAAIEGITGVKIKHAIEFNTIHLIKDIGYPNTLFDIIPSLRPDIAAYSSYESTNVGTLLADFPTIESKTSGMEVAITEYGFSPKDFTLPQASALLAKTTKEIQSLVSQGKVSMGQVWQAYEDGSPTEFGILNNKAENTPLFDSLLTSLNINP